MSPLSLPKCAACGWTEAPALRGHHLTGVCKNPDCARYVAPKLPTYHVFEVATDTGHLVYVDLDRDEFNKKMNLLYWPVDPGACAVGTVEAASDEEAVAKVLRGNWSHSGF